MRISSKPIGGDERYDAPPGTAYFAGRDGGTGQMVMDGESPNGTSKVEATGTATVKPRLPSLDLEAPAEPVFADSDWLDEPAGSLADHPLLRGLLLELPPKGSIPPPGWLDRWFEATRSILELLYVQRR